MSAPEVDRSPIPEKKSSDHHNNTSSSVLNNNNNRLIGEAPGGSCLKRPQAFVPTTSSAQVRQLAETAAAVNSYNSYARSLMLVQK